MGDTPCCIVLLATDGPLWGSLERRVGMEILTERGLGTVFVVLFADVE